MWHQSASVDLSIPPPPKKKNKTKTKQNQNQKTQQHNLNDKMYWFSLLCTKISVLLKEEKLFNLTYCE